ncbi:MAG: hypothetical protein M3336_16780, partial [Chloroflexota bacterium]|nr:hypothetical protein [Chloroflexota bacterium]
LQEHVRRAAAVRVVGGFSERNRWLATSSDVLVAVWCGLEGGGTAETIALARAAGTPIREIRLLGRPSSGDASGRGV